MIETVVGYAGGTESNPSYRSIMDYTEAIRVIFNPNIISFAQIIDIFIKNGGATYYKSGSRQYRIAVFYHNDEQYQIVTSKLQENSAVNMNRNICTDVEAATEFYRAEEYHQKYYEKSGSYM